MKKISLFFVFLMMSVASFTVAAGNDVHGDLNGDGKVSITDVTTLINYLLSGDVTPFDDIAADVNEDNNITISDVTSLINLLLSGGANTLMWNALPANGGNLTVSAESASFREW